MSDKVTTKDIFTTYTCNNYRNESQSSEEPYGYYITPKGTVTFHTWKKPDKNKLMMTIRTKKGTHYRDIEGKWLKLSEQAIKTRATQFIKQTKVKTK